MTIDEAARPVIVTVRNELDGTTEELLVLGTQEELVAHLAAKLLRPRRDPPQVVLHLTPGRILVRICGSSPALSTWRTHITVPFRNSPNILKLFRPPPDGDEEACA